MVVKRLETYAFCATANKRDIPFHVLYTILPIVRPRLLTHELHLQPARHQSEEDRFVRLIKSGTSLYLREKPNVSLSILFNLYNVFDQLVLTSTILNAFNQSVLRFLVLDIHLYGQDNVTLLVKFNHRTYLVVLNGKYSTFYDTLNDDDLEEDDVQVQGLRNIFNRSIAIGASRLSMDEVKVMLAVPITPSQDLSCVFETLTGTLNSMLYGQLQQPLRQPRQQLQQHIMRQMVDHPCNVPLDVLVLLHGLFEWRKLTNNIIEQFRRSSYNTETLDEDVLLQKYKRRVYLIIGNVMAIPILSSHNQQSSFLPFDSAQNKRLSSILLESL